MVDLKILQWIFFSSNNTRKRNMIPEIIFNIRFEKVCSSSLCFLPGQEPHYPSSTSPHLFWNNIFTSKIIMSETWDISGHLSLHYFFVSKSKYSEILNSFCAGVSLSSLPNSNFFMFVWAVDRAESIDPDGVIHNPKGRKLDRVSVMNEIICKAKGIKFPSPLSPAPLTGTSPRHLLNNYSNNCNIYKPN